METLSSNHHKMALVFTLSIFSVFPASITSASRTDCPFAACIPSLKMHSGNMIMGSFNVVADQCMLYAGVSGVVVVVVHAVVLQVQICSCTEVLNDKKTILKEAFLTFSNSKHSRAEMSC